MALGKAIINIMANLSPLKKGLANAASLTKKMVGSISRGAFNVLKTGLRKIITLAKLASVALLGIGIASAKIAADSAEAINLFNESLGDSKDEARAWAEQYSES